MYHPKEIVIFCGFERQFSDVESAMNWIHEQEDYKNKSVKYSIRCGREVEVDSVCD